MAKLENPYTKVLDEINECLSLHKIESNRIAHGVIEGKLEETVKKYVNDPKVSEIRAQKKISEDDQGYLDINIFVSTFYKNKLDIARNFDKEYKKFLVLVDQYKNLIQERITQFELNASLLSKFTEEEIKNNPKLSKMMKTAPEGFDETKKKYIVADADLTKIYADYISRNGEEYSRRLLDFLNESKQFRKQFMANKQKDIEELKIKPAENSKNQVLDEKNPQISHDFSEIKQLLTNNETMSSEEFSELKNRVSKVLTPVQVGELNAFEESIRNEYNNSNTTDSLIKKRLDNSLNQFQKGVDRISDLIVETGSSAGLSQAISQFKEELFAKPIDHVKKDAGYINILIGYCCGIKKYLGEADTRKGLFKKVDSSITKIEETHNEITNYLINKVGVEESLLGNNMLGTMITQDKLGELSYVLMNNAARISNDNNISNWEEEVNKIISLCISEMIDLLEQDKAPTQAILRFKEQYLYKGSVEEEIKEEKARKRERSRISQDDQGSTIKRILQ